MSQHVHKSYLVRQMLGQEQSLMVPTTCFEHWQQLHNVLFSYDLSEPVASGAFKQTVCKHLFPQSEC